MQANATILRLLAAMPVGIPPGPTAIPAIQLSGTGSVTLVGDTLWVTTGSQAVAVPCTGTTVRTVAAQLPPSVTATVLQDGAAELLVLPQAALLPATVAIATAPLWQVLAACARVLDSRRQAIRARTAQINARIAQGEWLDWWGASLGVGRLAAEPDALYGQRVALLTLAPTNNNTALVALLSALGYAATVTDTGPGQFTVTVHWPAHPPTGFTYTQSQVASLLDQVKVAGFQALLNWISPLFDTLAVADSVTSTSALVALSVWGGTLADGTGAVAAPPSYNRTVWR